MLDALGVPAADPLAAPAAMASDLREHRQRLVAAISTGTMRVADVIVDRDLRTSQVKVLTLAEAVPGVGKVTSRRLLSALGIADGARWGELTEPAARRVVAAIEEAGAATGGGASPAAGT